MGVMQTDPFQVEYCICYLLDTAFWAVYHEKGNNIY